MLILSQVDKQWKHLLFKSNSQVSNSASQASVVISGDKKLSGALVKKTALKLQRYSTT